MKKILGVIVLGLLLTGCASTAPPPSTEYQKKLIKQNDIKIGMSYFEIDELFSDQLYPRSFLKNTPQYAWGYVSKSNVNYIFKSDLSKPKNFGKWMNGNLKQFKLIEIFYDELEVYDYLLNIKSLDDEDKKRLIKNKNMEISHREIIAQKEMSKEEKNKAKDDKQKADLLMKINKAKDTCRTLGFKEDTDKFSDCTLKLYSQEVDNNVALEVAKQKSSSSSSSGTMTIYDPVRDRQNQIDRGMKMLSGGCTLGIDC